MTLLDLLNVYRITTTNSNLYALLLEMFEAGNVDSRIDRDILAKRLLMDCGRREPRYNTTDTFLFFGSVWLKSEHDNIVKTLDLLTLQYNPLNEYEEHKLEDIDREHITNGSETKTRDVDTTDTLTSTSQDTTSGTETRTDADIKTNNSTDEHLVSAENESGVQLRTRDTHNETVGDNASVSSSNSETTNASKSNSDHEVIDEDIATSKQDTTTHDDTVETTIAGHKTAQAELIRAELEKAKLNIYDKLIDDFADIMFINVF